MHMGVIRYVCIGCNIVSFVLIESTHYRRQQKIRVTIKRLHKVPLHWVPQPTISVLLCIALVKVRKKQEQKHEESIAITPSQRMVGPFAQRKVIENSRNSHQLDIYEQYQDIGTICRERTRQTSRPRFSLCSLFPLSPLNLLVLFCSFVFALLAFNTVCTLLILFLFTLNLSSSYPSLMFASPLVLFLSVPLLQPLLVIELQSNDYLS